MKQRAQVPFVFIFLLLTAVPLTPVAIYMLAAQAEITPLQRALQAPQLLFLAISLYAGIAAVRLETHALPTSLPLSPPSV